MNEAESGVIGCVLIDSSSLYNVYNILKPDMFLSEFCKDCFSEMLAMYDRGEQINVISISQELENHKWDKEYISSELKDCAISAPVSGMIKSYANAVIQDYKARTVKELFQRVSLKSGDIDNTISEVLIQLEGLQSSQKVKSKSLKTIVKENCGNYFNEKVGIKE